ncbi:MAG: exosome complex exonuclease Rrp41 [Candidatus Aenigmarchaeota archaeon]|nr:exosome complex exonuclease Rrp41 [Candidatus Aenigmarchaeota archaeon]
MRVLNMKRIDGRKADELRELEIEAGVLRNATGSARVRMGRTIAVAGVYGPREMFPRRLQKNEKATVQVRYTMAPFSTDERVRPGRSRRSQEISMVAANALEAAVFTEDFPKASIDVFVDIIQADAGTRTAAINAAAVALADAGVPMRDMICSVAIGKIDGTYVVDLAGKEEDASVCDFPVSYMPNLKKVTHMQMDGNITKKDMEEMMKLVVKTCEKIHKAQKEALEKRWLK